jgi:hypothetical protein
MAQVNMPDSQQTILKFELSVTGNMMEVMSRFHPQGQTVLNRTTWRGKEPRTCGVTALKGRPRFSDSKEPIVFDVQVSYRPKGCITYVGNTRYDGWTAMVLDRAKDGTLLDGHGQPLPKGQPPVYLPYELYKDVEFNDIDFGEYKGEEVVEGLKRLQFADIMKEFERSTSFNSGIYSNFISAHRQRPSVKIILTNEPYGTGTDGFGTRIININVSTPQLQTVIVEQLDELVTGFMEGRYSIPSISNTEFVFVRLDDILVDCTPNEQGKDSRFKVLNEYVPETYLEDLAKRLMSTYLVEASIVEGEHSGLVLRHVKSKRL